MRDEFQFLLYQSVEETVSVNAVIMNETIWLSQKGMAELFGCSSDNISLHLKNIFNEGELLLMGKNIRHNITIWTPLFRLDIV